MNTIFLLTSGFFMATTVHQYHQKDFKKANFFLNITMLGGLLFLILKSVEYYMKIESGNTMGSNSFFTYYWLLTGFHVIHVIVGLMILLFLKRGLKRSETETEDIEASAAFWHMCDLIWLILFPTLYLIL
jgi:nitric oxide reductase NorE protein